MTGPRLLAAISLAIAVMGAAIALSVEPPAAAVVRWTARTSLTLFALVYVARPAAQLWPSPTTRGLLARRKWLGLGFASSQAFHLGAILALGWPDLAGFFSQRPPNPLGVASFVAVAAMTVTSVERVRKAMARRWWRALHLTGLHVAWVVFVGTYARRVGADPRWAIPLGLLAALAAVRTAAWWRQRRRRLSRVSGGGPVGA